MTEPEKPAPETEPETAVEEDQAATEKAPTKRRRWPWVVAALAALFLAGAGTGLYFKERLPFVAAWLPEDDKADAELIAMQARLDGLERALSSVRADVARHGDDISRLDAEDTRLATGIARAEALARTVDAAAPAPQAAGKQPDTAPVPAPVDDGPLAARLDMLMLRMGQLESAFVPLSEKVGRQEGAEAERATIAARTETLDTRIDALGDRLARLEQSASADAKQALLVLTYAALRRAAENGRPIAAETQALTRLAEGDARAALHPALDRLQPLAATLTPSLPTLEQRFPATVRAILDAARLPEGANWWQKIWAKLTGLVTLRPTGDVAGDHAEAIVARAERRLGNGDLEGAVGTLGALSGPPARAAESWLADARRRINLDAALDEIEAALGAMTVEPADTPADTGA